jgi:hypothetical protein
MTRLVLLATSLLLVVSMACGSDAASDEGVASTGDTNEFGFQVSMTAKSDSIFTIDDVISTGWKSSKEFPPDELEGVSAVWFGFFQQKNLEVWIYDTHDDAKRLGVGRAEEIVAATRGVSFGGAGPYMKQTTHYGAYGVVGNLIILCESEVAVCEDLAAALP